MTRPDTVRIARNAWDAHADHVATTGCGHAQLLEVIDGMVIGDTWQGDDWPGGDPAVLLGDWCCHTRATHLVLVSPDVRTLGATGPEQATLVLVCGRDGTSAVLVGPVAGPPTAMSALGGALTAAMRAALSPDLSQYVEFG